MNSERIKIFWSRVQKTDNCWNWTGSVFNTGYGCFVVNNKSVLAHRLALFLVNGKWPIVSRHICNNRKCVRVDSNHLIDGNYSENAQDCVKSGTHFQASKTHCPQGHEYNDQNTCVCGGARFCRVCARERMRLKRGV
jgi:hypothetical protein